MAGVTTLPTVTSDEATLIGPDPAAPPPPPRSKADVFMRRLLRDVSPSGRLSERQPGTNVLVWWKDPAEPAFPLLS